MTSVIIIITLKGVKKKKSLYEILLFPQHQIFKILVHTFHNDPLIPKERNYNFDVLYPLVQNIAKTNPYQRFPIIYYVISNV